jgi:riboflavin kinase/FMN adenylyltransferase
LNLARAGSLVDPADGVYAALAGIHGRELPAAASIGVRPTLGGGGRRLVEAHLIGYSGPELYGQAVELKLIERIRGQERFDDLEALRSRIARDVAEAEMILSRPGAFGR